MKKMVSISCLMIGIAGCAPQTFVIKTQYNPADHDWAREEGISTISGQAFLRTRGGDVRTCAGRQVILSPDTEYIEEVTTKAVMTNGGVPSNADSRVHGLARTAICNAQGNFVFKNLPVGRWMILTNITWETGNGPTGGLVIGRASTRLGENTDVIVTR